MCTHHPWKHCFMRTHDAHEHTLPITFRRTRIYIILLLTEGMSFLSSEFDIHWRFHLFLSPALCLIHCDGTWDMRRRCVAPHIISLLLFPIDRFPLSVLPPLLTRQSLTHFPMLANQDNVHHAQKIVLKEFSTRYDIPLETHRDNLPLHDDSLWSKVSIQFSRRAHDKNNINKQKTRDVLKSFEVVQSPNTWTYRCDVLTWKNHIG